MYVCNFKIAAIICYNCSLDQKANSHNSIQSLILLAQVLLSFYQKGERHCQRISCSKSSDFKIEKVFITIRTVNCIPEVVLHIFRVVEKNLTTCLSGHDAC